MMPCSNSALVNSCLSELETGDGSSGLSRRVKSAGSASFLGSGTSYSLANNGKMAGFFFTWNNDSVNNFKDSFDAESLSSSYLTSLSICSQ